MNTSISKSEVKIEAFGLGCEDLVAHGYGYAWEADQVIVGVGACHGEGEEDSGGPDFVHGGVSEDK